MAKVNLKPRVKMDDKCRVVIPQIVREQINVGPGTIFEIEVYGKKILLTVL